MYKIVVGIFLGVFGAGLELMMQVGSHDAATNFCTYLSFYWPTCLHSLPDWFASYAPILPAILVIGGLVLVLWAPLRAIAHLRSPNRRFISLHEAAAQLYGELRGTDLARFIEGHTRTPDEILQNAGMQLLHNADVYVRRAPSPNWEIFPRSNLNKMGVHNGATDIRYWGQDQAYYSDPKVSRRDVRRVIKHLKKNANFVSEWSKAPPPQSKEPEDIADSYPNLRVADFPRVAELFDGDKLIPLLEAGKITAWGRRGSGEPPLIKIPGNIWASNDLFRLPKMQEQTRNQTFIRPKGRRYETIYFDVHLNRAQMERAWPQDVHTLGLDCPTETSEVGRKAERDLNAQALAITLHDGPAYEAGLKDANGNNLPDDWVFLARLTGGDKSLTKCQIVLEDRNGHNFTVSKPFDIRPGEQKDLPVLRFKNKDPRDCRAFIYMLRPDDWEISPDGPALLLGPERYRIKVLSAEATPAILDVHLSKHPKLEGQWILEEVRT
jgi:hypothetical protein